MQVPEHILPEGWETDTYGDLLLCPCGNRVELDGKCPNGHESPLIGMGLI